MKILAGKKRMLGKLMKWNITLINQIRKKIWIISIDIEKAFTITVTISDLNKLFSI